MLALVGVGIVSFLLGVIVATYWLIPKVIVGMVYKIADNYINYAKEKDNEDQP